MNNLNVGEDAVVMGNVSNMNIGNGSVVIGATDNNGNVILNTSMAVGRNAKAGPGSIAIGANAGAGVESESTIINNVKGVQINNPSVEFKPSLLNI